MKLLFCRLVDGLNSFSWRFFNLLRVIVALPLVFSSKRQCFLCSGVPIRHPGALLYVCSDCQRDVVLCGYTLDEMYNLALNSKRR
jgi:hypothetical protein